MYPHRYDALGGTLNIQKNGQKTFTNMYQHRYDITCHLH